MLTPCNPRITSRRLVSVLGAALVAASLGGCGGGSPTAPTPTPTPAPYAGDWIGKFSGSSRVDDVQFTVTGGEITSLKVNARVVAYTISNGMMTIYGCENWMALSGSYKISGTTFEVPVSSAYGSTTVRGSFTSTTTATGSILAFNPTRGCAATVLSYDQQEWTGSKR